ncbi:MAG: glycogen debranching N-terminal domain-containing protein [Geminicoccaceae bacterium]
MAEADTNEPRTPARLFALKHGDTFVVADAFGDITGDGDGLFQDDTRLLSRFRLTVAGRPLELLGGAVSEDNVLFTANLTNLPLPPIGGQPVRQGAVHLERTRLIWQGRMFERWRLRNYGQAAVHLPLRLEFGADFRDMFEVRGLVRAARGQIQAAVLAEDSVVLSYVGLDDVVRSTTLIFGTRPKELAPNVAEFALRLAPQVRTDLFCEVAQAADQPPSRQRFRKAAARARLAARADRRRGARLQTGGRVFRAWLERSRADLALLTTDFPTGPYPYAGIPWFSTAFGRDAIITALQMLWLDPSLARGVLRFLAANQATETSRFTDAAPGKIMHETRKGEMVRLGELPFERYYGGVDTTPLFVALAGAYAERTGDLDLIEELWPSLLAAVGWIEGDGDSNHDGLIDYARGAETGLANQGWKDSEDSVFDQAGNDVEGPIALVEVQGYAFAAFRAMAELAARRGESAKIRNGWKAQAERLRRAVEERFWLEQFGTYALALDGRGLPCRVRASNAGHLLFVGLPSPERGRRVAEHLLNAAFNTGWGLRTLGSHEPRYNPMSYHNGSVWPHDTAICAAGIARYGRRDGTAMLLSDMFETAVRFDMRLPELFCGFPRRPGEPPIAYPVACLPQAWAAGSVFMMLQACLGLVIDGWSHAVRIERPRLPVGIDRLTIRGLASGPASVDLIFQRVGTQVAVYPEGDSVAVPVTVTV